MLSARLAPEFDQGNTRFVLLRVNKGDDYLVAFRPRNAKQRAMDFVAEVTGMANCSKAQLVHNLCGLVLEFDADLGRYGLSLASNILADEE